MCVCICIRLHLPISSQSGSSHQCNIFSLGQLRGFGACSERLYKILNYTSHFKTTRTAGKSVIKGPPKWPSSSFPGVLTTKQHKHRSHLPVPPLQLLQAGPTCPPIGGLYWIFLLFLCLVVSGIYIDNFTSHTGLMTGNIQVCERTDKEPLFVHSAFSFNASLIIALSHCHSPFLPHFQWHSVPFPPQSTIFQADKV